MNIHCTYVLYRISKFDWFYFTCQIWNKFKNTRMKMTRSRKYRNDQNMFIFPRTYLKTLIYVFKLIESFTKNVTHNHDFGVDKISKLTYKFFTWIYEYFFVSHVWLVSKIKIRKLHSTIDFYTNWTRKEKRKRIQNFFVRSMQNFPRQTPLFVVANQLLKEQLNKEVNEAKIKMEK